MTLAATQTVRQRDAGRPLRYTSRLSADTTTDDWDDLWIGVTTTDTEPTIQGDFAYHEAIDYLGEDRNVDRLRRVQRTNAEGGVAVSQPVSATYVRSSRALDSNFVAGRYMWTVAVGPDDGSNTPVLAASAPYLIE